MPAFDAESLRVDPADLVLPQIQQSPTSGPPTAENRGGVEIAPRGRVTTHACAAACDSYRWALMFRVLFTGLVAAVSLAAATALVFAIIRFMANGADVSAIVSLVSGVVASGGALYLGKRMNEAIRVARTALHDVGKYCGQEKIDAMK